MWTNAAWRELETASREFPRSRRPGSYAERLAQPLSYRLCYHPAMAQRQKRSISLPPEVAQAIDQAAAKAGMTFSSWLSETAAHRLRLEAGRRGLAEWEQENGPLTAEELAEGLARARAALGATQPAGSSRRSA